MSDRNHRSPRFNSGRVQFLKAFGKPIETYASIKRAVETVGDVSKYNYYRDLPRYFIFLGEDPDLVILNRRKHLSSGNPELEEYYERKTTAFVNTLKDRNLAGRGIVGIVGRVQGFYTNNSKRYSLDLKNLRIPKARKRAKFSPENSQVRELLSFADQRGRLIVTLMYQCGPAPVDVSELRRGDIPREAWAYFEKSRSKTGEVWRGVTTPDICAELNAYLKLLGEGSDKDLLFRSREGFLDNEGVSRVVADLINRAGYSGVAGFVPKCLRDGLEDALVDANINSKVKEALMAHTSDIQHQYGSDKKMQERLVAAIKTAYPFISLSNLANPAELAGFSAEDVEFIKMLRARKDKILKTFDMLERGELVNINDPDLPEKLRKKH